LKGNKGTLQPLHVSKKDLCEIQVVADEIDFGVQGDLLQGLIEIVFEGNLVMGELGVVAETDMEPPCVLGIVYGDRGELQCYTLFGKIGFTLEISLEYRVFIRAIKGGIP
jgi:hypothetical protein